MMTSHLQQNPWKEEPAAKRQCVENDLSCDWLEYLSDIVKPSIQTGQSITAKNEIEFMHYVSEPANREDPLVWWKRMEPVFPNLSKLAKKYLCVPASSVPSERVFSTAGNLINKRRASLAPDNVDMLIFLNKNIDRL